MLYILTFRYSNLARNEFFLNSYSNKGELLKAIGQIDPMKKSTNTSGGIRTAMKEQFISVNGERSSSQNIIILLTDGASNIDEDRTISDAEEARSKGIDIFTVGITSAIDEDELRKMSSLPQEEGKTYFKTANFQTLLTLRDLIGEAVCDTTQESSTFDKSYHI